MAGKRLGKEDDRHLWPEMLRAIREIQPRWIVGENVRGIISWGGGLVFDEVQSELEAEGYEVLPFLLPAVAKNAPHRRDRVWFVAYSNKRDRQEIGFQTGREINLDCIEGTEVATNTSIIQLQTRLQDNIIQDKKKNGTGKWNSAKRFSNYGDDTNTNSRRQSSKEYWKESSRQFTETGLSNYWSDFPTQSPICSRNDGISGRLDGITFPKWRNESIKAYGNAVVPQIPYEIFKAIEKYEQSI